MHTAHPLDRPVWATLVSHPALAEGSELAKRCRPDINLFASTRDDGGDCQSALAALLQPGDTVYLLQVPRILQPPGLTLLRAAHGVQMVAGGPLGGADIEGPDAVLPLGDADAADMLALAQITQPGPFLARTHTMGAYVGVRIDGRLVAMAGERMRLPGHVEVSGVCTHPDYRGRGLARRLSAVVAQRIQQRGDRPFLHVWASNTGAVRLYEGLGFQRRVEVNVSVMLKAG